MFDQKRFIDDKFGKGIYDAVKAIDPNLILQIETYHEDYEVKVVGGKEVGKRQNIEPSVEFKNGEISLLLSRENIEPVGKTSLDLYKGNELLLQVELFDSGSVLIEGTATGYTYFPKKSKKGYVYTEETIDSYISVSGNSAFFVDDFDNYYEREFPINYINPDDVIVAERKDFASKIEAAINYGVIEEKTDNNNKRL